MATSIHRARDDARAMRARADGRERWWTSSSSTTTKAEARDARTGTVEEDDGDDGSERALARVRTNLDARARRGAVGTRGGESETRALFAVSSSTRRREVTTRETRVRAPLRFRLGVDAVGRADARFEVARVDAGERAIEEDARTVDFPRYAENLPLVVSPSSLDDGAVIVWYRNLLGAVNPVLDPNASFNAATRHDVRLFNAVLLVFFERTTIR